jgi:hypothetical protein
MLDVLRCHVANLANAINFARHEVAWLERREVERAIDLAEHSMQKLSVVDRASATGRLKLARGVIAHVLALAPYPSVEAITDRSARRWANQSVWQSEQRQWIAERATKGQIDIASVLSFLTSGCVGDA